MGVGVNVQDRMIALHHMDAPIRPMDFEQRNGRILRQGNMYAAKNACGNTYLWCGRHIGRHRIRPSAQSSRILSTK